MIEGQVCIIFLMYYPNTSSSETHLAIAHADDQYVCDRCSPKQFHSCLKDFGESWNDHFSVWMGLKEEY